MDIADQAKTKRGRRGGVATAVPPVVPSLDTSASVSAMATVLLAPPEQPEHPSPEAAPSPAVASDAPSTEPIAAVDDQGPEDMATIVPPAATEAADKAQAAFGDLQGRFKAAADRSQRAGEELMEFGRGNAEALMASARAAAKAGETLGSEAADYGRKSFEAATAAWKGFAAAKSPTELFQLQSDYAKSSFDQAVAEASRLSETMMKLAGEIAQPLSNRYALAAEKVRTVAA